MHISKFIRYPHVATFVISIIYAIVTYAVIPANYIHHSIIDFIALIFLFLLCGYSYINKIIGLIIVCVVALAIYIGPNFGSINMSFIASLFETSADETTEFLSVVPFYDYIFAVLIVLSYIYIVLWRTKASRKGVSTLLLLILFILLFRLTPFYWLSREVISDSMRYFQFKKDVISDIHKPSTWHILSEKPHYNTYVVIVGESMRRDYMSLYGYPVNDTPYLHSAKGLFFTNYISAAPNTVPSLERTLDLTHDNKMTIDHINNVITLANQAGFDTYWLSNQGYLGVYDTAAARIAYKAKRKVFLKKGEYDSQDIDDTALLPILNKIVSKNTHPKVIFLHIMGSHPNPCDRLNHQSVNFSLGKGKQVDCYVSSYLHTDHLIKSVYQILNDQHRSFSINYFSDHGMVVPDEGAIHVSNQYQEDYMVPFLFINSDSKVHQVISTPLSAFQYIDIYSHWLGIETEETKAFKNFDTIKLENPIKVFDWKNMIEFDKLPHQQRIYPANTH